MNWVCWGLVPAAGRSSGVVKHLYFEVGEGGTTDIDARGCDGRAQNARDTKKEHEQASLVFNTPFALFLISVVLCLTFGRHILHTLHTTTTTRPEQKCAHRAVSSTPPQLALPPPPSRLPQNQNTNENNNKKQSALSNPTPILSTPNPWKFKGSSPCRSRPRRRWRTRPSPRTTRSRSRAPPRPWCTRSSWRPGTPPPVSRENDMGGKGRSEMGMFTPVLHKAVTTTNTNTNDQ